MKSNKVKNKFIFFVYFFLFSFLIVTFNTCTEEKKAAKDEKDYLQIERRKLLKTKGDIKAVGDSIMQYVILTGKAPDISDISELKSGEFSHFKKLKTLTDGWGNDFLYYRDSDDDSSFYIASSGKDGKFEGWEQKGRYNITELNHYNMDVIYSNGSFLYTSN